MGVYKYAKITWENLNLKWRNAIILPSINHDINSIAATVWVYINYFLHFTHILSYRKLDRAI